MSEGDQSKICLTIMPGEQDCAVYPHTLVNRGHGSRFSGHRGRTQLSSSTEHTSVKSPPTPIMTGLQDTKLRTVDSGNYAGGETSLSRHP